MPIALPGFITGIALNSYFAVIDFPLSALTLIVAHGIPVLLSQRLVGDAGGSHRWPRLA